VLQGASSVNPSVDVLEVDTDSFDVVNPANFAVAANKKMLKRRLAKQDFSFLYNQKKGELFFNENGVDKGFGDGGIIAILKGAPDLTVNNLNFV
jgi:polyhydroxybutyrate depolymerase